MNRMITIAERLTPFSHFPKARCMIPGTPYAVEVFPALLRFYDYRGSHPKLLKEFSLPPPGLLDDFTVQQDLEKSKISVWGKSSEGFFRYHILPTLEVVFERKGAETEQSSPSFERLSLGSHKKQDWELIRRREDFREIFPLWFRLGQSLSLDDYRQRNHGMFSLLEECREVISRNRPEQILFSFRKLFRAGFTGMLTPRLKDEDFQGILQDETTHEGDTPLFLLSEGAKLIRSLFMAQEKNHITLLPRLPPEFFAGRLLHINCAPFGEIDVEWTKKMLRRMVFRASSNGEVLLRFPPSLKQFRVRHDRRDRGRVMNCGDLLELKSGSFYLLDQFKK